MVGWVTYGEVVSVTTNVFETELTWVGSIECEDTDVVGTVLVLPVVKLPDDDVDEDDEVVG